VSSQRYPKEKGKRKASPRSKSLLKIKEVHQLSAGQRAEGGEGWGKKVRVVGRKEEKGKGKKGERTEIRESARREPREAELAGPRNLKMGT